MFIVTFHDLYAFCKSCLKFGQRMRSFIWSHSKIRCIMILAFVISFSISFAQWHYRSQWGSTEARLLLIENLSQYPARRRETPSPSQFLKVPLGDHTCSGNKYSGYPAWSPKSIPWRSAELYYNRGLRKPHTHTCIIMQVTVKRVLCPLVFLKSEAYQLNLKDVIELNRNLR